MRGLAHHRLHATRDELSPACALVWKALLQSGAADPGAPPNLTAPQRFAGPFPFVRQGGLRVRSEPASEGQLTMPA